MDGNRYLRQVLRTPEINMPFHPPLILFAPILLLAVASLALI